MELKNREKYQQNLRFLCEYFMENFFVLFLINMLYKLRIFVRNPRARKFRKKSRNIPLENNAEKMQKNKQGRKYHWCISQIINTTIYKFCFFTTK